MKRFVILKGKRFWKENNLGYTDDLEEAKIFTEAEADAILSRPNSDKTKEELV